ncbi:hypothetical protein Cs7R123_54120 [Catellatospora sp. TT07R-123]|uniref:iron chaperone n=1 Tax=Catellatospora sp. TT07R-123 TaxID=2733863 RepID=UPI001B1E689C|nr:DUF1801 domain-containing protein [Catellatospora sp. TT07R-123]GHJ48070.1 hypothetical protein Cs7R123_54120 [Catellatospora sp. TT07R-123]
MATQYATVDDYLAAQPDDVRDVLLRIRQTALSAIPGSAERISYNIPTVTLDGGNVLHYSGWKNHVSVYPVPNGDEALDRDVAAYRAGKGTLKFPLAGPVPYELIARVAAALAERRRREHPRG